MTALAILAGCAPRTAKKPAVTLGTLAELRKMQPDMQEVKVEQGLEQAMQNYRRFLEETPQTEMTPEAMRRLADLQLEKQFGIHTGEVRPRTMAAPQTAQTLASVSSDRPDPTTAPAAVGPQESDQDFERRTTAEGTATATTNSPLEDQAGPLEAITLYDRLLTEYPNYEHRDKVLYQKARAFDELGRTEEAIETMESLIRANPNSPHFDEVQFRRGEFFFTRRKYRDAENAYTAVMDLGSKSSFYELAIYKLGWTFYKQDLY
jgi:TolA-binding protein